MGMREAWAHRKPGIIWQIGFESASDLVIDKSLTWSGDDMLLLCEAPFDRRWGKERYDTLMRVRDRICCGSCVSGRCVDNLLVQAGSINEVNPSDAYHLFGVIGLAGVILDNGAQRDGHFLRAAHASLNAYGTGLITEAHRVDDKIRRYSVASKCSLRYYNEQIDREEPGFASPETRRLMVDCRPKQGIAEEQAWRGAIGLARCGAWIILGQWQMRDARVDDIRSAYRMGNTARVGLGDGGGDADGDVTETPGPATA